MATFATISDALCSDSGIDLHLKALDRVTPLYAYEDKAKGWTLTTRDDMKGAIPCIIKILSKDNRAVQRKRNQILDDLRKKNKALTTEQIEAEAERLVASSIIGWSGIPWSDAEGKGYLLPFTDENLLMFVKKFKPAQEQVNEAVEERDRFFTID